MASPLAVVTGASSGIGEAFSRQLSGRGFRVIAVARRIDRLKALEVDGGDRVIGLQQDLREPDAAKVVAQRAEELGGADLLVSNAGRGIFGPFERLDARDAQDIIQLNVTFPVDLIHRLLPTMLARRKGGLIVVTSAGAHYSTPNLAVYGGTKAFLLSFTEALATELQGTGVRALALCPGPTSSEFGWVAGMSKLRDGAPGLMTPDQVGGWTACLAEGPGRARAGRYEPGDDRNDVEASPVSHPADRLSRVSRVSGRDCMRMRPKMTLRPADISAFSHTRRQEFLSRAGPGFRRRCPRGASRPDFEVCWRKTT